MSLADKFAMDMKSYFGTPLDSFRREKYSSVVDNSHYVRLSDRLHNGDNEKRKKQSPFKDYNDKAVNHESIEKADHEQIPDEIAPDKFAPGNLFQRGLMPIALEFFRMPLSAGLADGKLGVLFMLGGIGACAILRNPKRTLVFDGICGIHHLRDASFIVPAWINVISQNI